MKRFPQSKAGFSLVEWLLVVAIVGILIFVAIPSIGIEASKPRAIDALANAKSLHTATLMMTLDTLATDRDGMIWTSMRSNGVTTPASLSTFLESLVENGYMTDKELRKVLTAPGKGPRWRTPNTKNICFKIFQITDDSPSDQPFLVTANWNDRQLTKDAPYGQKGFVVFTKGGSGGVYTRPREASSTNIFPAAGTDLEGKVYSYETLK